MRSKVNVRALTCLAATWLCLASSVCFAQRGRMQLPEVERPKLQTRDGVGIACTYYPGGVIEKASKEKEGEKEYVVKPGKEVVPVILVHDLSGRRGDFDYLASYLQRLGHAIIVPDLRGHGSSTLYRPGRDVPVKPDKLQKVDFANMLADIEATKKFLLEKNNAGEVNIDMLTVVGAGLGAGLALKWSELDWSRRQLPAFRQGRDIKALVLLSPERSTRGFSANDSLNNPAVKQLISMMIVVGKRDRSSYSAAKSINNRLEKPREMLDEKNLYFFEPDTSLSGVQLVDPRARLPVPRFIGGFINERVIRKKADFAWKERKNPLADG